MKITLYKGFLSAIDEKISKSNRIEYKLTEAGGKIDGSNRCVFEVNTGKELVSLMETLRRMDVTPDLVISGWK